MSQSSDRASELHKTFAVLTAAIALVCVVFCVAGHSKQRFTLRELYPWNLVKPNDNWYPALSHPDPPEIITVVLTDWLRRGYDGLDQHNLYEAQPDFSHVRLLRFQLPSGFVPSIERVGFVLQDQASDNRDDALMGHAPGDFGLRFDRFKPQKDDSIEFIMCLLQYADRRRIGGYSLMYRVHKAGDLWVAKLEWIET